MIDGMLNGEDSSKPIMDTLHQFYEFADNSGSLPLAAACMREARSFILASFRSDDTGAYWCLSLPDQVALISTILIPLARKATQRAPASFSSSPTTSSPTLSPSMSSRSPQFQYPNPYTHEMLVALLSTANDNWSDPVTVPILYAVDSQSHGEQAKSGSPVFHEFSRKIDGLVMQFCGSSPAELAIAVLQSVIDGINYLYF